MKLVPVKTPNLIKLLFRKYTWDFYSQNEKKIYLTFDDGPIPDVTEFVLEQLKEYNARATFFCIGNNIHKHPTIFSKIIAEGHSIGNHTMDHTKAWNNDLSTYIKSIHSCKKSIETHITLTKKLFRPPYGQISRSKLQALQQEGYQVILWDIVAKDWDESITPEQCYQNIIKHSKDGSIIVFHDSIKASKNLRYALPKVLSYFSEKGYIFDHI